jgi:hypothetical protein
VTVSVQELQQAAEEEPGMVVQDQVQGAKEEPRLLKEPVTVSVQELVQGVEDKPRKVRELVVAASRGLELQDGHQHPPIYNSK